jgi:hypothetical protein
VESLDGVAAATKLALDVTDPTAVQAALDATLQNDFWNVQVSSADQSVAFSTREGEPLLNLRLQGTGPCVMRVEAPSGVQVWGLGQCFADPDARVDLVGHRRTVSDHGVVDKFRPYGRGLQSYVAGTEGYIQIPLNPGLFSRGAAGEWGWAPTREFSLCS